MYVIADPIGDDFHRFQDKPISLAQQRTLHRFYPHALAHRINPRGDRIYGPRES